MRALNILHCSTDSRSASGKSTREGVKHLYQRALGSCPVHWVEQEECELSPGSPSVIAVSRREESGAQRPIAAAGFDLVIYSGRVDIGSGWFTRLGADASIPHKVLVGVEFGVLPQTGMHISPAPFSIPPKTLAIAQSTVNASCCQVSGPAVHVLPSPALFSAVWEYPVRYPPTVGLVYETSGGSANGDSLSTRWASQIANEMRTRFRLMFFGITSKTEGPTLASAPFRDALNRCDIVISFDLAYAVIANSLLKPAILIEAAPPAKPCPADLLPFVLRLDPSRVYSEVASMNLEKIRRDLFNWKRFVEYRYVELLADQARNNDFNCVRDAI